MRRARLIYLAVLLGAVIFCIANGRWLSWFLLLMAAATPLLSLLVSLPTMRGTKMAISAPARLPMGCDACVSASIRSKWLQLPFHVKLSVFQPLTGEIRLITPEEPLPTDHCGGLVCAPEKALPDDDPQAQAAWLALKERNNLNTQENPASSAVRNDRIVPGAKAPSPFTPKT